MQVGARADKMSTRILRIMSMMREGAGVNYEYDERREGYCSFIVWPLRHL